MTWDSSRATAEEIQILRKAFERLVAERRAVSAAHRESIGRQVIIAARDGVTNVAALVSKARQS